MKKNLIFFLLLLLSCTTFGQLVDSSYLKVNYKFLYQNDSSNLNNKGQDLMVLEVGNKSSVFYSYYRNIGDSLLADDSRKGTYESSEKNVAKYEEQAWRIKIYQNYPDNQMTVIEDVFQFYRYTDSLNIQHWSITSDTSTKHGLLCQKAITTFRGRTYEAWFTKDIPLHNGPWKFYGLPGLIVYISDIKGQFVFDLAGIDQLTKKKSIVIEPHPDGKTYVKVTRKEMWNLKKDLKEDPLGFLENNSGLNLKFVNPVTPQQRKARKEPYNPLELE